MESLEIKKLSAGTIYRLMCTGTLTGFLPLCLLFGILGAFGMDTVKWNGQAVTGVKAIFIGPLLGVFISLLFTAILGSVVALGLWIYSFFKPMTIIYFESD